MFCTDLRLLRVRLHMQDDFRYQLYRGGGGRNRGGWWGLGGRGAGRQGRGHLLTLHLLENNHTTNYVNVTFLLRNKFIAVFKYVT